MIKVRTMDELEEFLIDKLSDELPNFSLETLEDGKIVIFTGLIEDPDGGELMEEDDLDIDPDDLEDEEEEKNEEE